MKVASKRKSPERGLLQLKMPPYIRSCGFNLFFFFGKKPDRENGKYMGRLLKRGSLDSLPLRFIL
jgi:hypothetical protein